MRHAAAAIVAGAAVMGYAAAARADDQARRVPTDGAVALSYSRAPDVLACTTVEPGATVTVCCLAGDETRSR